MLLYRTPQGEVHSNSNRVSFSSHLGGVSVSAGLAAAAPWNCWRSFSAGTSGDDVAGRESEAASFITSMGWVSTLSGAGRRIFGSSAPVHFSMCFRSLVIIVPEVSKGLYDHSVMYQCVFCN